jgi:Sugar-transfer associated ATP-grasp
MAYLSATAEAGQYDVVGAMNALAAKGGPGFLRQAIRITALAIGRQRVRPEEYFTYALWRKDRGRAFVRDFLSNARNRAFNTSLQMPDRGLATEALNDKLQTEALLVARGLPFVRTRAVFAPGTTAVPALPDLAVLRGAEDIAAYLEDPAHLPVFGKPRRDSFARGAAAISGPASDGAVQFLFGPQVPIRDLAAEIARDWTSGYLFQPFCQTESSLRAHVGAAMASIRIVTLWTEAGIVPWYAVIRLPAKTAMHDGDAVGDRIWGLIDVTSGEVIRLRNLRNPEAGDLTHGNTPDLPFLGFQMPHWAEAIRITCAGHESFPGHGIIGWDVFLTEDGALLNEANVSPGHVYQVASQRPLLNADMRPAYARARAFAQRHGGGKQGF